MKYKLGQLGTVYSGGTPSTKNAEFWDGDIAWITPKDLAGYSRKKISKGERNITDAGLSGSSACLIPAGSVLMSSRAPIGYVAIANNELSTNQGFKSINCDERICLNEYIYYWIKSNIEYIKSKANGSTFKEISGNSFKNLDVDVPDLETQQKIVRILSALDQKIELNNQQNETIEKQALALVQKYINNEKGTAKLKEIMSFDNGFAFKSKNYVDSGKYKVITIKNVQDGLIDSSSAQFVTDYPKDMRDYHKLSVGDVLVSLTGNVGRVGIVFEENLLLNQRVAKVKPKDKNLLPFLYFLFRKKDFKQKLEALAKGTAQLNLSPVETLNEKIAYSEQSVFELSNRLKPFFEKIVLNNQNNKTLSSIRDSLLPKLMSGDVNLDKVTNE